MKEYEYTSEADFVTEKIEFTDEHSNVAQLINGLLSNYSNPVQVGKDKKSLIVFFDASSNLGNTLDRVIRENNEHLYRIIVEKI